MCGRPVRTRINGVMVRSSVVWLAGGLLVACGAFTACGGGAADDDDEAEEAPDAGEARAREGGVFDAGEPEPACDPDADLLAKVSDASIADGASTTGICLGCARARCSSAIAECTMDCACQRIVGDAIGCYVTTKQITCAAALADIFVKRITRQYALTLLGCVESECASECVIDGGVPDASVDDAAAE